MFCGPVTHESLPTLYTAAISEQAFVSQALTNILDAIARDYPATLVDELERRREHVAVAARPA
jgi:hypothetical protein